MALRCVSFLTLEVPPSSIIKRIRGNINASGLPVNFQWPLMTEGLCIRAVHVWCYEGHSAPAAAMETLAIVDDKKKRALEREADEFLQAIPEDLRLREGIRPGTPMIATARIAPRPRRPPGSAGAALLMMRKKLKRQRRSMKRHRARLESMNLPLPLEPDHLTRDATPPGDYQLYEC